MTSSTRYDRSLEVGRPPQLLNWTKVEEWRTFIIEAAIRLFAPSRDQKWLVSRVPEIKSWDAHDWCQPLADEHGVTNEELLLIFGKQIPLLFESIRLIHLCRPVDFESYRTLGILRLDPARAQSSVISFLKTHHPSLKAEEISRAIERASQKLQYRKGRVFLALDERAMLENAGHYAVFGSEYELVIANELYTGRTDFRQTLRLRGKPAYVVVHLPMGSFPSDGLADLAHNLLCAAIASSHLGLDRPYLTGYGIDVTIDVPPEMIRDIIDAPEAKSH